mmetsp:Transcript_26467/g.32635  ORF Transcript_26467/g.32635 Transcript_26467/m.32635 type:complete len:91 (+) Transcript_26467:295-567(+)
MVNVRDLREVSRRMTKANDDHMKAMHRVMKYCVDTPSRGWVLRPNRKWDGKDTTFEFIISGKSDSNYATCKDTSITQGRYLPWYHYLTQL